MQTLTANENEIIYLPVDKILPNPYQSRKIFDSISLEELASSIKKYGVIKPLTVRYINNNIYELISGERRLKACKMLGFSQVPTFVKNTTNKDSVVISLVENMQRENLNFFEEAETFQKLMVDFGCNIEDISKLIGKKQKIILDKLMILSLNKELKKIILENKLSEGQAIVLLKIKDFDTQMEVLQKIVKYKLNVEHSEKLVNSTLKKLTGEGFEKSQKIKGFIRDIRIFTNTIKNAVDIMKDSGVDTNYNIIKNKDGYEINIKVSIEN